MAYIEWVDAAGAVDDLAPKKVEAPVEKKEKPARKEKPDAKATGAPEKKKRNTLGSRKVHDKARRAEEKARKIKAAATLKAKPKPATARVKTRKMG